MGEDGGSHQAVEDLALMRILPNLVVLMPADGPETRAMTRWAAAYRGPVYMRTGRMALPLIYDDTYVFELGRGSLLREGGDVTLMGIGIMVQACLEAAAGLAQEGIEARVANLGCLSNPWTGSWWWTPPGAPGPWSPPKSTWLPTGPGSAA